MNKLTIILIIFGIFVALVELFRSKNKGNRSRKYQYKQKHFFMTRAEHECYDVLIKAIGDKYQVFPQVHLPSIVDCKVKGQYWNAAFRHINQKSVDFVLCDKAYLSPKLAIELDDHTHKRPDRIERDREVERVLSDAGLPLLRLENHGSFNPNDLALRISTHLGIQKTETLV